MIYPPSSWQQGHLPCPGKKQADVAQRQRICLGVNKDHTNHPPQIVLLDEPSQPLADSHMEEQLARILARVPSLLRLPAQGSRCPHTQLCRTAMLDLVAPSERNDHRPPVRAIHRRAHKYAQRGVWLIPAENLFRYLLGLMEPSVEELQTVREQGGMKD